MVLYDAGITNSSTRKIVNRKNEEAGVIIDWLEFEM